MIVTILRGFRSNSIGNLRRTGEGFNPTPHPRKKQKNFRKTLPRILRNYYYSRMSTPTISNTATFLFWIQCKDVPPEYVEMLERESSQVGFSPLQTINSVAMDLRFRLSIAKGHPSFYDVTDMQILRDMAQDSGHRLSDKVDLIANLAALPERFLFIGGPEHGKLIEVETRGRHYPMLVTIPSFSAVKSPVADGFTYRMKSMYFATEFSQWRAKCRVFVRHFSSPHDIDQSVSVDRSYIAEACTMANLGVPWFGDGPFFPRVGKMRRESRTQRPAAPPSIEMQEG